MRAVVAQVTHRGVFVDCVGIAGRLGNPKAANVVLLGALSAMLEREGLAPGLTQDTWLAVLAQRVPPKYLGLSQRAFQAGREAVTVTAGTD